MRYHTESIQQAERDAMKNSILKKYEISLLRMRTDEIDLAEHILSNEAYDLFENKRDDVMKVAVMC